jgi:haloacetate dehalogenase
MAWALNSYHWMFMAQPYDFPERLLRGNEEYYIGDKLMKQGLGKGGFTEAGDQGVCARVHAGERSLRVRRLPCRRRHRSRDGQRRLRRRALPCGHYPSEQAPEDTYRELRSFFSGK